MLTLYVLLMLKFIYLSRLSKNENIMRDKIKKKLKIKIIKLPELIFSSKYSLSSIKSRAPFYPPLSLGMITAHLRNKGFFVEQDDLNIKLIDQIHNFEVSLLVDQNSLKKYIGGENTDHKLELALTSIVNKTKIKGYDALLISKGDLYLSIAICKKLKELVDVPIIMGGLDTEDLGFYNVHKTALKNKYIDYLIDGPGTRSILLLLESLNNSQNFKKIPGLIYIKNKKIIKNLPGKPLQPTKPDFKGLPLEKYLWDNKDFKIKGLRSNKKILILPFKFIEGCPHSCIFCLSSTSKLDYLNPKKVVKYLKELSEEYNTKYFYFLNNLVNPSKKYINELCDEIIKNNLDIYWMDSATVKNLDKGTILKMRQAGCVRIFLGLETFSQRLLTYFEKGITVEQAYNVLRWLNEAQIWTHICVICGLPTETESDINETISFLNKNRTLIDKVDFNFFGLIKKSLLFRYSKKYGLSNIQEIPANETSLHSQYPYLLRYEVNNLSCEEVVKKIFYSQKVTKQNYPYSLDMSDFEQTPFLFLLYTHFNDKTKIKNIYNKTIIFLSFKYGIINIIKKPRILFETYKELGFDEFKIKIKMLLKNLI